MDKSMESEELVGSDWSDGSDVSEELLRSDNCLCQRFGLDQSGFD